MPDTCTFCGETPGAGPVCADCEACLPWDDRRTDGHWAAFRYEGAIASRIRALKFHAQFLPARVLGTLMAQRLARRAEPLPEVVLPVPLHAHRVMRRGYNQALEIARHLAPPLGLTVAQHAARRVRATGEQTHLDAAGRRQNLRGAFEVTSAVRGRHIALLDDVVTTGATLGELAKSACAAGAARVELWAAARAALRQGPLGGSEVQGQAREHGEAKPVAVQEG